MSDEANGREVYFEFVTLGNQVKVSAICSVTGTEVHVMAPVSVSQYDLQRLAMRKLDQRIARERPDALPGRGGGNGGSGVLV